MKVVASERSIAACQTRLFRELDIIPHSIIKCNLWWRLLAVPATVHWSEELVMWWYTNKFEGENRWLNFFGVTRPRQGDRLKISCEINTPIRGIDRGVVGCFIVDGEISYFVHRGNRWGGGKRGLNKQFFWENFTGCHQIVADGDKYNKVAVVCQLGAANLPMKLSSFVHWLSKLKSQH